MKKVWLAIVFLGLLSSCEKQGVREQRNLTLRLFYWEDVRTGLCFAYLAPASAQDFGSNTEVPCDPVRDLLPPREPSSAGDAPSETKKEE